jgi:hypothetical protein
MENDEMSRGRFQKTGYGSGYGIMKTRFCPKRNKLRNPPDRRARCVHMSVSDWEAQKAEEATRLSKDHEK